MSAILIIGLILAVAILVFKIAYLCRHRKDRERRNGVSDPETNSNQQISPQISTIYTQDFSRQNDELPTYTEIFVDDLPTYYQVINENKETVREHGTN